jgi:hypothetical protein
MMMLNSTELFLIKVCYFPSERHYTEATVVVKLESSTKLIPKSFNNNKK